MKGLIKTMFILSIGFIWAQEGKKEEKGYRIKVVMEKDKYQIERPKEVHFVSPDGKIVKKIKYSWSSIVKKGNKWLVEAKRVEGVTERIVLYCTERYISSYDPIKYAASILNRKLNCTVKILNSKGVVYFKKEFQVYEPAEIGIFTWDAGLSWDGSTIYVCYRDSSDWVQNKYNIEVYDTTGKQLARANISQVDEVQISPDGKIVGAILWFPTGAPEYRAVKHLFFLDVETGRTKMVKAEGEINGRKWSCAPDVRRNKKIGLIGGWHDIHIAQSAETSFDELPDNLSILFERGGKK